MEPILLLVSMGAIFYFLLIRPQQKRLKAQQQVISELTPGTRVLLTSGVFATVRHLGERQAIVELAPGVEVTLIKGNIARPTTAEEEEFEFSDDADSAIVVDEIVDDEMVSDEVVLPEDVDDVNTAEADTTFDPRGDEAPADGDISAEELQRRFDN
ncbi:MAG: preprotein translocase subunit YajC [Arachnia sp.]